MKNKDLLTKMFTKKIETLSYNEKDAVYRFIESIEVVRELAKRGSIPKNELEEQIKQARLKKDELMLLLLLYNKMIQEKNEAC